MSDLHKLWQVRQVDESDLGMELFSAVTAVLCRRHTLLHLPLCIGRVRLWLFHHVGRSLLYTQIQCKEACPSSSGHMCLHNI